MTTDMDRSAGIGKRQTDFEQIINTVDQMIDRCSSILERAEQTVSRLTGQHTGENQTNDSDEPMPSGQIGQLNRQIGKLSTLIDSLDGQVHSLSGI